MPRALLISPTATALPSGPAVPAGTDAWPPPAYGEQLSNLKQTLGERGVAPELLDFSRGAHSGTSEADIHEWLNSSDGEPTSGLLVFCGQLTHTQGQMPALQFAEGSKLPFYLILSELSARGGGGAVILEVLTDEKDSRVEQTLLDQAATTGVNLIAQVHHSRRDENTRSLCAAFENLVNTDTLRESIAPTGRPLRWQSMLQAIGLETGAGSNSTLLVHSASPQLEILPRVAMHFESERIETHINPSTSLPRQEVNGVPTPRATPNELNRILSALPRQDGPDPALAKTQVPPLPSATPSAPALSTDGAISAGTETPRYSAEHSAANLSPAHSIQSFVPVELNPRPGEVGQRQRPGSKLQDAISALKPAAPSANIDGALALAQRASVEGDSQAAVQHCLRALAATPHDLKTFLGIINILAHFHRWSELLDVYEQLIDLQPEELNKAPIYLACSKIAGTHLLDPKHAASFMTLACQAQPAVAALERAAARLHQSVGNNSAFREHSNTAIRLAPLDPESYRDLADYFKREAHTDSSWHCAGVMSALGSASDSQQTLLEQHASTGLPKPTRALTSQDFAGHRLVPATADSSMQTLLKLLTPGAESGWRLKPKEAQRLLAQYTQQDVRTSTTTLARALVWSSTLLGIEAPNLYITSAGTTLAPLPVSGNAWVVSRSLGRGPNLKQLVFMWARALAKTRPENRMLLLCATESELVAHIEAANALVRGTRPKDKAVKANLKMLKSSLSREQLTQLTQLLSQASEHDWVERSRRWRQLALFGANRCGLSACADVAQAHAALRFIAPANLEAQLGDLFAFAVGPEYAALRRDLGIALPMEDLSEDVNFTSI